MNIPAKEFPNISIPALKKEQIDVHLGLYNGYVSNLNALLEELDRTDSKKARTELLRRIGFEWSGMRNHEIYFETVSGTPSQLGDGQLMSLVQNEFDSFEVLRETLMNISTGMRGPGWVFLGHDSVHDVLVSTWIADHELGVPVGVTPLVMIDMWEHAYFYDGVGTEKKAYVESYLDSIDWSVVENRIV